MIKRIKTLIYLIFDVLCSKRFSMTKIKEKDFWYLRISMTVISNYIAKRRIIIIIIFSERKNMKTTNKKQCLSGHSRPEYFATISAQTTKEQQAWWSSITVIRMRELEEKKNSRHTYTYIHRVSVGEEEETEKRMPNEMRSLEQTAKKISIVWMYSFFFSLALLEDSSLVISGMH